MKCREFDRQLCDYLDGALDLDERRLMDDHALSCANCSQALAEADLGLDYLRQAPRPEPPPELIADIIHDTVGIGSGRLVPAGGGAEVGGLSGWLRPLFAPILQPRLVMSMAMTVLSFSMLTFYGQRAFDRYETSGDSPATVVTALSRPVVALWDNAGKAINAAVAFYELQTEPFRATTPAVPQQEKSEPNQDAPPGGAN